MKPIEYALFAPQYFDQVIALATDVHGANYMDEGNIQSFYDKGFSQGINASWVALDGDKLVGFRITYASANWQADEWCTPEAWGLPKQQICYFKCNTVDAGYRGHGIGSGMLKRSIDQARLQGHKAGLAHIWLASPGNSAYLYFSRCGGKTVKEHANKWQPLSINDGYHCPVCGTLCTCTAAEMLLNFDQANGK